MARDTFMQDVLADLGEDISFHLGALLHRAFDGVCLLALGLLIYASGIDQADAGMHRHIEFTVEARIDGQAGAAVNSSHAPSFCSLNNDLMPTLHRSCTTALELEPATL